MNVLNSITANIYAYPVRWASFVRAVFLLATAFGMTITTEQMAAVMMVVESGLMLFTHQQVTPNANVEKQILKAVRDSLNATGH